MKVEDFFRGFRLRPTKYVMNVYRFGIECVLHVCTIIEEAAIFARKINARPQGQTDAQRRRRARLHVQARPVQPPAPPTVRLVQLQPRNFF